MYDLKASMYLRFISDSHNKSFNQALSHKLQTLFLRRYVRFHDDIIPGEVKISSAINMVLKC